MNVLQEYGNIWVASPGSIQTWTVLLCKGKMPEESLEVGAPFVNARSIIKYRFCQCCLLPGNGATYISAPNPTFSHPFMIAATGESILWYFLLSNTCRSEFLWRLIPICCPWLYYCRQLTPLPVVELVLATVLFNIL